MSTKITDKALEADWLGLCRRSAERLEAVFTEFPSTAERKVRTGLGAGGDQTLVIDEGAEDVVFAELDRLHAEGHEFTAIAEERGVVAYGGGESQVRVVIDPIDGSLNAKRLLPTFALSVAVASGDAMEDVELAYVYDFGAGEEFVARSGKGATLDGEPLRAEPPVSERPLELVGVEAAKPELMGPVAESLAGEVYRLRVIGSLAISLCYLAAARFDGMLGLRPARSVDVAAGQLIAREAGASLVFEDRRLDAAGLGLDERYQVAGASTAPGLQILLAAQRQVSEQ